MKRNSYFDKCIEKNLMIINHQKNIINSIKEQCLLDKNHDLKLNNNLLYDRIQGILIYNFKDFI